METLTLLRLLHGVATVALLGSVIAVIWRAWRSWRGGDPLPFASTLQRPWLFAWVLMGISLLSFPVSGWWLVHTVGWPLGQTWILSAAVLYMLGAIAWLLLVGKVNGLRAAQGAVLAKKSRNVLINAGVALVLLLVILGLMVTKPV